MADIIVRAVSKSYGNESVLSEFSAVFPEGKRTAIMGPSGCGKTTLLRIISGLEKADSGEIQGLSPGDFAMVFQEARLFEAMSAEQNVSCVRKDKKDGFAVKILVDLGFELADLSKRPSELSGGMQRRVAIARALAYCDRLFCEGKRPVLLLDEAVRELDARSAVNVRQYIVSLCERTGCTVIAVTHDDSEANLLCHDILKMS
ncbi:MAG: ABC transporter ATP-binding protein [Clostridia bacterium]|nr:ABC transporter ATP-binding protein [Clostridia bacterium]